LLNGSVYGHADIRIFTEPFPAINLTVGLLLWSEWIVL
jgi:hypothetical protein